MIRNIIILYVPFTGILIAMFVYASVCVAPSRALDHCECLRLALDISIT